VIRALATLAVFGAMAAPAAADLNEYVGALHEHSAYSDGWPGTRPADVFASGKGYGLDFLGISDHSDNMGLPLVFSEACYGQGRGGDGEVLVDKCALADQVNPADSFRKWDATAEQASAVTTGSFTGFRGFEWSSDRFGHISVYFSSNWTGAYQDGGFVDMSTFWKWFERPVALDGGLDGIATFNHPGAKDLEPAPGFNWNDFTYEPAADERMVGIEVYNDKSDYGTDRDHDKIPGGYYAHALDKGWHVGAVGAEDLGHRKPPLDNWGGPQWPKTVVIAASRAPADIKAALLARRFYAIAPDENALRLTFTVDGQRMGSRIERHAGEPLKIAASTNDQDLTLELVTSKAVIAGTGDNGRLAVKRDAAARERWYFVRARRGTKIVAYSSPVWVTATEDRAEGTWLAGDMHVHTCYSHDAYCGPTDDEGQDAFYSFGGTILERFTEASVKGLDFLNISDHNDIRAWSDPDFGSHGVVGLHSYEASLAGGHAHVIGVEHIYDRGPASGPDEAADSALKMADAIDAAGGIFQANHPSYKIDAAPQSCDQMGIASWKANQNLMHWKYGFEVVPNSIEVWNPTTLLDPSERYWECWLQRGIHMPATAGSDTHGAQGQVGSPTTWVFARSRSEHDIVRAVEEGRTSLSRLAPALGGLRLLLEGDSDGDGKFESMIGDTVKPGATLRVRAEGLPGGALLGVRSNGRTLVDDQQLQPGRSYDFEAPADAGWVRAILYLPEPLMAQDPGCTPNPSPVSLCSHDLAVAALTSPIYLGVPKQAEAPPAPVVPPGGRPQGDSANHGASDLNEPDDDKPMTPAEQSRGEDANYVLGTLRTPIPHLALRLRRHGRRLVVSWSPRGDTYDIQVKRRSWRTAGKLTRAPRITLRSRDIRAVRVRVHRADGSVGAWTTRRMR
jgi:predicted metal-dependent phosphoesterase TrpH